MAVSVSICVHPWLRKSDPFSSFANLSHLSVFALKNPASSAFRTPRSPFRLRLPLHRRIQQPLRALRAHPVRRLRRKLRPEILLRRHPVALVPDLPAPTAHQQKILQPVQPLEQSPRRQMHRRPHRQHHRRPQSQPHPVDALRQRVESVRQPRKLHRPASADQHEEPSRFDPQDRIVAKAAHRRARPAGGSGYGGHRVGKCVGLDRFARSDADTFEKFRGES